LVIVVCRRNFQPLVVLHSVSATVTSVYPMHCDSVMLCVVWCSALEAMRKAHELELEKERKKYHDLLAKMPGSADLESLQKQHEYEAQLL